MLFYHGTTKENYQKILKEGILWGVRNYYSRCTYLTKDLLEAKTYGEIILEVEYDPAINEKYNNYCQDCWQFRVYEPISIENIRILNK